MARARRPLCLRASISVRLVALLLVAACSLLLLLLVVVVTVGDSDAEQRRSVQLELHSIAVVLSRLSNTSDTDSQRLVGTALGSLHRVGRLLGVSIPRAPPPARAPARRVCPERYINSTIGYPFFYDGWRSSPCVLRRGYGRLLTVLLTLTADDDAPRVRRVLTGLNARYPGVPALVAVSRELGKHLEQFRDVTTLPVRSGDSAPSLGEMLNGLVARAQTEYVLLASELERLDSDADLERLLREAERQDVNAVAGAVRRPDGRWSHGCFQVRLANYTLRYRTGYHRSQHECLRCDFVAGPLLARTQLLRRWPLPARDTLLVERWLLDARSEGPALVCPDVMFHVRARANPTSADWLDEARRLQVTVIEPPDGARLEFTCEQLGMACDPATGRLLSPCCRQQLLRLIHGVMDGCQQARALCELQEGTLLGAVKFGSILPWERDVDIAFSSAHMSRLEQRAKTWLQDGLLWVAEKRPYCCHDNRTSGGVAKVYSEDWLLELWGQHLLDTEKLRERGLPPTRVQLDGRWYPAPRNPGLYVRNRYGHEVYRHAEHWMDTGGENSWEPYDTGSFQPCDQPGHHSCLDQYSTDGVIQFEQDAWPEQTEP